jgi:hypothetical protein
VLRNYTGKMPGLADCGYEDAGQGIRTPVKKPMGVKELDINTPTRNMLLSPASWAKEALRCFPSGGKRSRTSP